MNFVAFKLIVECHTAIGQYLPLLRALGPAFDLPFRGQLVDLPSRGSLDAVFVAFYTTRTLFSPSSRHLCLGCSRPLNMDAPSCQVEGPPLGIVAKGPPMILQVSPLPSSSDREEYFYNPSANVDRGPFAAA